VAHLVLDRLTKRYGDTTAVDDLSLAIDQGEFVSLLGPQAEGQLFADDGPITRLTVRRNGQRNRIRNARPQT
jgi:ABC-type lipopolysaccharide export system ATPase subunit